MLKNKLLSAMGGAPANYIEDVFSTWLYTGNGSTQTINNGIDLAGKGGLAWFMLRSTSGGGGLFDTVRGMDFRLVSSSTAAQSNVAGIVSATSTGLNLGTSTLLNGSGNTAVAWTFREAPNFFAVRSVTHTSGTATSIDFSDLGELGAVILKRTDSTGNWTVWHRSAPAGEVGLLNFTASFTPFDVYVSVSGTTAQITSSAPSGTYIVYAFSHGQGGFGVDGTSNVIQCNSYTGNGSTTGPVVNLGFEPQWVLVKSTTNASSWFILDNMRGWPVSSNPNVLFAQSTNAETVSGQYASTITPTGFSIRSSDTNINRSGDNYIYIAIRRGPMKTPTTGTSVFSPIVSSNSQGTKQTTNFPVDLQIQKPRNETTAFQATDRLRGVSTTSSSSGRNLVTSSSAAESTSFSTTQFWDNTGFQIANFAAGVNSIYLNFRRAPGFFDVVCYTGTGSARTQAHNLGVAPELIIVKARSVIVEWPVYSQAIGASNALLLDYPDASNTGSYWNSTAPTASVFSLGSPTGSNGSGQTYVAYLFASCPGVSKVGSYSGNGSSQTIACGFTGGARFVMIKVISGPGATGNWYIWDSARGIVSGTDPYLALNLTSAENFNGATNACVAASGGFTVASDGVTGINSSGYNYIFLAIA